MEVIRGIENWKKVNRPVVTVGSFDGVHLAHKAIIGLLKHYAELCGGTSVLITFSPHPRLVLHAYDAYARNFGLLSSDEEKTVLLERAGLDTVAILGFDEAFSKMPYDVFIEKILVETIGVKKMVVGYNHNFGYGRAGSYEQMSEYGKRYGFEVDRFPEQMVHRQHISSTHIRSLLEEGNVAQAHDLLGYEYGITGIFRNGLFNSVDPHKLLPGKGHYLVKVKNREKHNFTVCRIADTVTFPDLHTIEDGETVRMNFIKKLHLSGDN
ncbi:MAG: hypothetical protein K2L50_06565 [Bacteroidales bacterium]|nr:hypothetical protein [Bacteroidales bacterium]